MMFDWETMRAALEAAGYDATPVANVAVKDDPTKYGMSYYCKTCDVYGYARAGEPRVCWMCESAEISRR